MRTETAIVGARRYGGAGTKEIRGAVQSLGSVEDRARGGPVYRWSESRPREESSSGAHCGTHAANLPKANKRNIVSTKP